MAGGKASTSVEIEKSETIGDPEFGPAYDLSKYSFYGWGLFLTIEPSMSLSTLRRDVIVTVVLGDDFWTGQNCLPGADPIRLLASASPPLWWGSMMPRLEVAAVLRDIEKTYFYVVKNHFFG